MAERDIIDSFGGCINNSTTLKKESKLTISISLGVGIGTAVGVVTDNLGLWISLGVAIGAGVGTTFMQKEKKGDENEANENK